MAAKKPIANYSGVLKELQSGDVPDFGTQPAKTFFAGPTAGGAATPTFRSIAMTDLGTGTPSSSNFLRGDGSWQTVAASPAGSDTQIQFNNSGSFGASGNLTFDGNSLFVQTSSSSAVPLTVKGASGQAAGSNYFEIKRSDGNTLISIDEDSVGAVLNIHGNNGNIAGFYRVSSGGVVDGLDLAGYSCLNLINTASTTAALTLRAYGSAGAAVDIITRTYHSNWIFGGYTGAGANGGEVVMTDLNSGLETFHCYQSNNSNMGVRFPNGKVIVGGTGVPDAKLHVVATTEQLRLSYDGSNDTRFAVSSAGLLTIDGAGSSKGVKFASGMSLGFFGATPVTQRSDSGMLTDLTGGSTVTTLQDCDGGGGVADVATINDNFAGVLAKINALRTAMRDLGLMA